MFALQKIVFLFKILTSTVLLRNYGNSSICSLNTQLALLG